MARLANLLTWGLPFERKWKKQPKHWLTNMGRRGNGILRAAYTVKETSCMPHDGYVYSLTVEGDNSYAGPFMAALGDT